MLHELRIYTMKPGTAAQTAKDAAAVGHEIRGASCGTLEGYWVSEVGPLNQVLHLWSYPSFEERKRLRVELGRNERWVKEYVPLISQYMLRQDIRFLNPIVGINKPAGTPNLYELRTYLLKPGAIGQWVKLFTGALQYRERHSKITALWTGEAGQPNEVVHLWAYPSFEARMKTRDAVAADKDWAGYVKESRPLIEAQESRLMLSAPHSPLK